KTDDEAEEHIRKTRYRLVAVDAIAEGDVLGFAIYDDDGDVILEADTPIEEEELEVLRSHAIAQVFISKEEDDEAELRLGRLLIRLQKLKNKSRATRRIPKNKLSMKLPV